VLRIYFIGVDDVFVRIEERCLSASFVD